MQTGDGGFASSGVVNAESAAQVIVACTALGIDPDTDSRFVKGGGSAVDALLTFYDADAAAFRHTASGGVNSLATEQAKILFFINRHHIVIVDDDEFSYRLIRRIKRKKTRQGESKEKFIYNFMLEFISRDLELLGHYEKRIMDLEEGVMDGKIQGFQNAIMPIRRELLTLRSYYDEIMDMGKQLEENENGFFAKKQVKYFGVISDRADRLMSKASQLLEYAQQVRDAYKAQVDAQQNNNMQFLTVISTIFFPLTLITSWYGMNFHNMPELKHGYPGVIILSVVVMITCIIIFKRKKML